jgi:hypothetical protein
VGGRDGWKLPLLRKTAESHEGETALIFLN